MLCFSGDVARQCRYHLLAHHLIGQETCDVMLSFGAKTIKYRTVK